MKRRLLTHVRCPIDGSLLELVSWEDRKLSLSAGDRALAARMGIDPTELEEDILTGVLLNRGRRVYYPVHGGVPRLLPFRTGVGDRFAEQHRDRIRQKLAGYSPPSEPAAPGEYEVIRSFSNEWVNYDWTGQSYWNLTPEAWFRCMRFVLGLEAHPAEGSLLLEVGIGIGGVADHNARSERCEVVGIDLGYAVDPAFRHFGHNPFLHIVQASAFAPPFVRETFDFVYSFGVIHHTYSTRRAFDSIAHLPKVGGRLYVWVYSPHDEERNAVRRLLMRAEQVVRPVTSRMPDRLQTIALAPMVPLYMGYQALRVLRSGSTQVHYGLREAMHAARDRFAPRFIHRHADAEVCDWFRSAGYIDLECTSQRSRPDYVPVAFTACTGVEGVRSSA